MNCINDGINYMHVSSFGCNLCNSGNFQKSPGGLFIAARRHMLINMVLGFMGRNRLAAHSRLPGDA